MLEESSSDEEEDFRQRFEEERSKVINDYFRKGSEVSDVSINAIKHKSDQTFLNSTLLNESDESN